MDGEGKKREGEGKGGRQQCGLYSSFPSSSPPHTLASPSPAGMLRADNYVLPDSTLRVLRRVSLPRPQVGRGSLRLQDGAAQPGGPGGASLSADLERLPGAAPSSVWSRTQHETIRDLNKQLCHKNASNKINQGLTITQRQSFTSPRTSFKSFGEIQLSMTLQTLPRFLDNVKVL